MQGDTIKIKTDAGYFSCVLGINSISIIHPTPEDFDKLKGVKFIRGYREAILSNFSYISSKIVLVERIKR